MLEPQGTAFFVLLMVVFGALLVWMVVAKQVVFRVLAACLAFIPAMVFGIAAVNKYYDYYQTWGAMFSDLRAGRAGHPQGLGGRPRLGPHRRVSDRAAVGPRARRELGYLFRTTVTGPGSHITRTVFIYLPPQYFQKAYAHYRFPAIELLHGSPGEPETWINVLSLIPTYRRLLASHKADPAVLVMPDTDGGMQYGLQCLNDPGGLQDMTFVGREVPAWVSANLRVQDLGRDWGIAGYSEGGYCAANIGLQLTNRFSFVGMTQRVLRAAQEPGAGGQKPNGLRMTSTTSRGTRILLLVNTPDKYILHIPAAIEIPQFFLAAGTRTWRTSRRWLTFRELLLTRQPVIPR